MSFKHRPLAASAREIRLISVQPFIHGQSIQLELKHAPLDGKPEYEALSYTWGTDIPGKTIAINDQAVDPNDEPREICISNNLYEFLITRAQAVETADSDKGTWLWIDQICIDQTDVLEKNSQIPLMPDIYASATQVIVWLGPGFEGSDALMECLGSATISSADGETASIPDTPGAVFWSCPNKADSKPILHMYMSHIPALRAFIDLSYWYRVWICQEIALSERRLLCLGNMTISWHRCRRHLAVLHACFSYDPIPELRGRQLSDQLALLNDLFHMTHHEVNEHIHREWWQIIPMTKDRKCARTEDKVYGVLGMVEEHLRIGPLACSSLQDLYWQVLRKQMKYMDTEGHFAVLSVFIAAYELASSLRLALGLESQIPFLKVPVIVWRELRKEIRGKWRKRDWLLGLYLLASFMVSDCKAERESKKWV